MEIPEKKIESYCLKGDLIKYSGPYGCFGVDSKFFDDSFDLGGNEKELFYYIIKKIEIFTGKKDKNEIIRGIRLTYKNIKTKEIKELSKREGDKDYDDEDITKFEVQPGEYLMNFYIRFQNNADSITQLGFETNKKRKIIKGSEIGEEKFIKSNGGQNLIIGTFGHYKEKMDSFGVLYYNLKDYFKKFSLHYFQLKFKIKNSKEFREQIESKFNTLSESDKYLFKACLLPDAIFNCIMKFCLFEAE